jgi:uncharacterized membrane protein
MEVFKMRDETIDRLRGLSILIMFYAHLIPHYSDAGTKLFFFERVLSSIAAPVFLFLVGFNFNPSQSFIKLSKRILIILLFAALIDLLIWNIYPFYSFDVLYLIGFSLGFLFVFNYLHKIWKWLIFIILLISPLIINVYFMYSNHLDEPYLNEEFNLSSIPYNFFINGWFPFFPWMLFPLLGFEFKRINMNNWLVNSVVVISLICSIYFLSLVNFQTRTFAIEIFYPAGLIYLFFALSYVLFIWINRGVFEFKPFKFLSVLGKTSFFLYALHLSIYRFTADFMIESIPNRFLCLIIYSVLFWITAYFIDKNKKKWSAYERYEFLQVILGR